MITIVDNIHYDMQGYPMDRCKNTPEEREECYAYWEDRFNIKYERAMTRLEWFQRAAKSFTDHGAEVPEHIQKELNSLWRLTK